MSRMLMKVLGLILLLTGIYFLAQNVIFVSGYYSVFSQRLPASASVLAIMTGVLSLIFFRRETGNFGWGLLGIGLVLIFLSGGVIFRPISLWNLFVSFAALAVGFKLFNGHRINF